MNRISKRPALAVSLARTKDMIGNLFLISAPSGAGKNTLVNEVIKRDDRIKESISYTSRRPRRGEGNGQHYHFVSTGEFELMIENNDFLEWAKVHGNFYGTVKQSVEQMRADNLDVITILDVQGAEQVRRRCPDAISIFILSPSYQVLINRLDGRGADSSADLKLRMQNALDELACYSAFYYVVINDNLATATKELAAIILAERCRRNRRVEIVEQVLNTFRNRS